MKKCKADFIAKKYPSWIDLLDEVPRKKDYVEWLLANGMTFCASRELSYKKFLKDEGKFGPRYWREWKVKRSKRERKELENEK